MWKVDRPWVMARRMRAYSSISDIGTRAWMIWLPLTAPVREVAHDVAGELLGGGDFHLHDRLEDRRLGVLHRVLERQRAGDLERHFRGVDVVVLPVEQSHLEVDHRIAGEETAPPGL